MTTTAVATDEMVRLISDFTDRFDHLERQMSQIRPIAQKMLQQLKTHFPLSTTSIPTLSFDCPSSSDVMIMVPPQINVPQLLFANDEDTESEKRVKEKQSKLLIKSFALNSGEDNTTLEEEWLSKVDRKYSETREDEIAFFRVNKPGTSSIGNLLNTMGSGYFAPPTAMKEKRRISFMPNWALLNSKNSSVFQKSGQVLPMTDGGDFENGIDSRYRKPSVSNSTRKESLGNTSMRKSSIPGKSRSESGIAIGLTRGELGGRNESASASNNVISTVVIVDDQSPDELPKFSSAANMFPLGYHPSNSAEQLITVVFVVIGSGLYAIIVGAISSVAMGHDASGRLYKQKIDELKEYMKWKVLDPAMQKKVIKYYELKYRGKYFEEVSLLKDMNESLRMEIAVHNCKELISKVSFLNREQRDGRDELFTGRIASALESAYFVAGDFIFVQGEIGNDMFFILSGCVNVYIAGKCVATLREGAFFGEIALIANIPRTATVQAAAACTLYKLTKEAFNGIVEAFEDVKKKVDAIYMERIAKIQLEETSRKLEVAKLLVQKVEFLKQEGINERFVNLVAGLIVPAFFSAGDVVFKEGDVSAEDFLEDDLANFANPPVFSDWQ
ncbi:anaphase-promoting complex subunit Hcn1 [Podochytrium sp. JEL0797]|nr:anaphase-promoting complex subunit Hcn1 [Podochytrium sp. JEL0797]